ncbi:MAG: ferrochelatase [Thermoanaerobaculia bacterium]
MYDRFASPDDFDHARASRVGVLLSNLGTPAAPTAAALRVYLREFLADPRVIELPRWKWLPILHLFILTTRPKMSAALYRKVWTAAGSPLLVTAQRQRAGVEQRLRARFGDRGDRIVVALGMRYGKPSIAAALAELAAAGCARIVVLPLYPQYAAATAGSTFDAVAQAFLRRRWVPGLRTIETYHDEPGYIAALAASVRERWQNEGEPEKLLMSFHGMPLRYFHDGDPYFCYCQKTARLLAEALALPDDRWMLSFQSLFGKEEWLKPYTDRTVEALAKQGVRALDVICPGFSADCLETLEEIDQLNRETFLHNGGERFRFIGCLNERDDHLDFLADLVARQLDGWLTTTGRDGAETARRAGALGAQPAG